MWPWHVKMTTQTCWGCYCCSCWWWGTCWLRLWSPILVKMFKFTFCWYLVETLKLVLDQDSEDVWSRNYFGKQNSTLGSVVPLAMFFIEKAARRTHFKGDKLINWSSYVQSAEITGVLWMAPCSLPICKNDFWVLRVKHIPNMWRPSIENVCTTLE